MTAVTVRGLFEVWTVYIEDKSDMEKIADMAHLLFTSHPMRRAKKAGHNLTGDSKGRRKMKLQGLN